MDFLTSPSADPEARRVARLKMNPFNIFTAPIWRGESTNLNGFIFGAGSIDWLVGNSRGARSSFESLSDSSGTGYKVEGLGAADAIGSILKGISNVTDCGILQICSLHS